MQKSAVGGDLTFGRPRSKKSHLHSQRQSRGAPPFFGGRRRKGEDVPCRAGAHFQRSSKEKRKGNGGLSRETRSNITQAATCRKNGQKTSQEEGRRVEMTDRRWGGGSVNASTLLERQNEPWEWQREKKPVTCRKPAT